MSFGKLTGIGMGDGGNDFHGILFELIFLLIPIFGFLGLCLFVAWREVVVNYFHYLVGG